MKKILLIVLGLALTISFVAGCKQGENKSVMIIDENGAGSKTIYVKILKDHMLTSEAQEEGNTISGMFPQGQQPVVEWLTDYVPDGFTVEWNEYTDYWEYSIYYSFQNIDEYNSKTRSLIPDNIWEDNFLEEATLESADTEGGVNVTFRESYAILQYSVLGIMRELHKQEDIFQPNFYMSQVTPENHFKHVSLEVKLVDEVYFAEANKNELQEYADSIDPNQFIEVSAFISDEAPSSEEPGDKNGMITTFSLFVSLIIIALTKKSKMNFIS